MLRDTRTKNTNKSNSKFNTGANVTNDKIQKLQSNMGIYTNSNSTSKISSSLGNNHSSTNNSGLVNSSNVTTETKVIDDTILDKITTDVYNHEKIIFINPEYKKSDGTEKIILSSEASTLEKLSIGAICDTADIYGEELPKYINIFSKLLSECNEGKNFNIMDFYGHYLQKLNEVKSAKNETNAIACVFEYFSDAQKLKEAEDKGELCYDGRVFDALSIDNADKYNLEFAAKDLPKQNYIALHDTLSATLEFKQLCIALDEKITNHLVYDADLKKAHLTYKNLKEAINNTIYATEKVEKMAQEPLNVLTNTFVKLYDKKYEKCLDMFVLDVLKEQAKSANNWNNFFMNLNHDINVQACKTLMLDLGCFPIRGCIQSFMKVNSLKKQAKEIIEPTKIIVEDKPKRSMSDLFSLRLSPRKDEKKSSPRDEIKPSSARNKK